MFKQIIPLVGTAFLLFSCGGNSQNTTPTIDIDVTSTEIPYFFFSKEFDAKKGETTTFSFSYSLVNPELKEMIESENGATLQFYKGDYIEGTGTTVNIIDLNDEIKVSYNNEDFAKTNLSAQEWFQRADGRDQALNKTFYCGIGQPPSESQCLCYCHFNTNIDTDNVKITIKFADDFEKVKAVFFPVIAK